MSIRHLFSDTELTAAYRLIAERAGIAQAPTADRPHCDCTHPCPMPVLERGGLCPSCSRSESCLRANYRMATSRGVAL